MDLERQKKAPIYEALEKFRRQRVVPFDVPGHKRGRGNPELVELLGEKCVSLDVNSMKPLDNLCHPVSVIKDAEDLAADAFGAAQAFLMVGGTTSSVQSMILTACKPGDKIILPRNVHKSAINALVLCGAKPVYIDPKVDRELGIPLGMEAADVRAAIEANPDAVAVFINNPTYYGICSDLRALVELAHSHGMLALVDEAHGTHLYFGSGLPCSGMAAGADMAAVSMHKSGGSLTQSSILLCGPGVNAGYVGNIINLTQTTSGSYLLMASLDISRRNLAMRGEKSFARVVDMAEYARREINAIGGYYAYGSELKNGGSVYDFDVTKLAVNTRGIGLTGIEVYDLLRDEYDIQLNLAICPTCSPISRSATASRISSALSGRWPISGACIPSRGATSSRPNTSPRRSWPRRSRRFTRRRKSCRCAPPPGASAANSSCVTRRASPSWPRARSSRRRSSTTSSSPKRRAARCRARKAAIFQSSTYSRRCDRCRKWITGSANCTQPTSRPVSVWNSSFTAAPAISSASTYSIRRNSAVFLASNGSVIFSEKDEFTYDEMIVHVPMAVHPNVKRVLVIGGGDGGVARELSHYQEIEVIDVVEPDKMFVDVCRKFFPDNSCGAR